MSPDKAQRIEERHQTLLAEAPGFLLPPDLNQEGMTAGELQAMQILQQEQAEHAPDTHEDARRTERLLLLVLRHLDVSPDEEAQTRR